MSALSSRTVCGVLDRGVVDRGESGRHELKVRTIDCDSLVSCDSV